MGENFPSTTPEGDTNNYEVVPGIWQVGDFTIDGEYLQGGEDLTISGEDGSGRRVDFRLRPSHVLALLDILAGQKDNLEAGAKVEPSDEARATVNGGNTNVVITSGDGPEPIPENVHARA